MRENWREIAERLLAEAAKHWGSAAILLGHSGACRCKLAGGQEFTLEHPEHSHHLLVYSEVDSLPLDQIQRLHILERALQSQFLGEHTGPAAFSVTHDKLYLQLVLDLNSLHFASFDAAMRSFLEVLGTISTLLDTEIRLSEIANIPSSDPSLTSLHLRA